MPRSALRYVTLFEKEAEEVSGVLKTLRLENAKLQCFWNPWCKTRVWKFAARQIVLDHRTELCNYVSDELWRDWKSYVVMHVVNKIGKHLWEVY